MPIAERHPTRELASVQFYGKDGTLVANIRNLSKTGMCIQWTHSNIEVEKGDLVRMTVVLKALNRKHHVTAEVVWKKGRMGGLNFLGQDAVLEKMMSKLSDS